MSLSPKPRFHRLRLADVRRETADAVSLAFAIPEALREDFRFSAGQYLTLRHQHEGDEIRRSYSICTTPDDGELRIAIKRIDGGLFSSYATADLAPGAELAVMTPTGRFGVVAAPAESRTHAAFAAGSGITPILSIVRFILAAEPKSRVFLFYGNRTTADMLFREQFEDLKDRHLGRLSIFHVLSKEQQDIPILNGRLDAEKARLLLRHVVPASAVDHAFVCGPTGMAEDIEPALIDLGIAPDRIHIERFVSALGGAPRVRPHPTLMGGTPAATVSLTVDGRRAEISLLEGETILDAALRAGLDLPYACKGGMCSTCRARVLEGAVQMDVNFALEPWEVQAGYALTCQARPTTQHVVVDYDHV